MNEYKSIGAALQELEDELKMRVPKNTGALANSIKTKIEKTEDGFIVEYEMLGYGVFQDKGVSGLKKKYDTPYTFKDKMPPAKVFSKYTSSLSEQFAIARSVYTWGIKPKNFIKPAIDAVSKKILDYTSQDIMDYMEEQIKKEDIFKK